MTERFTLEAFADGGTRLVMTHETALGPEHDALLHGWIIAWPRALGRLALYLAPGAAGADA